MATQKICVLCEILKPPSKQIVAKTIVVVILASTLKRLMLAFSISQIGLQV